MTKYALLHHPQAYTNVCIGIGSACMYKGHFIKTFSKARIAQSVEHQATNLKLVGCMQGMNRRVGFYMEHRRHGLWTHIDVDKVS